MKKFLKKIFPIVLLKRAFVAFNTIKIHTLDKLLYRTYHLSADEVLHTAKKNPFLELGIDLAGFSENIRKGFLRWTDPGWFQDEYIVHIKNRFAIDPITGWAITSGNKLIYESLGFSRAPYVRKPSILRLFNKRNVRKFQKIISLRDTGEENYFHFFNDILPKIWLLKDHESFEQECHVVVSECLWRKDYFQYYLKRASLEKLKWVRQTHEWIEADSGFFCKPFTHTKKYILRSAALADIPSQKEVLRIFLTRSTSSMRFIENDSVIRQILESNGFTTVDTANVSFEKQIELFARAEVVVAIHGAGTSNIIFRSGMPLQVLEIFHPNPYLLFHYIMLSKLFGYKYTAIEGTPGKSAGDGGFLVDQEAIRKFCTSLA